MPERKLMPYLDTMDAHGFVDATATRDKGRELAIAYNAAAPFPHVIIDDFLPPAILELCLDLFPEQTSSDTLQFDRGQERYKVQYNPDILRDELRTLFYAFNARTLQESKELFPTLIFSARASTRLLLAGTYLFMRTSITISQ